LSEVKVVIKDNIENETKSYQISYLLEGVITYQDSYDEFYWNVTPSDITVPINNASIKISLPSKIVENAWKHQIYSQAEKSSFQVIDESSVRFSSSKLSPGEDFTIVLGWPKKIVDYRLNRTKIFQIIALLLPLLSIVGLIIYHYHKKAKLGLNRSIAPEFVPPEETQPILVEGLIKEGIGASGLTSSLISIAQKGYIKIVQKENKGIFSKNKEYSFKKRKGFDGLPKLERRIAEDIFKDKDNVKAEDLKNDFYKDYKKIVDSAMDKMMSKKWFHHKPGNLKGIYVALSFVSMFFGVFGALFLETTIRGLGFIIGGLVLGLLIWLIYGVINTKKTKIGVETWQKWQGFKMFLAKTERFKMSEFEDQGEKVEVGESVFEKYLPYALALGVADVWANRFKDFKLNKPEWLEGDINNYSALYLASSLNNLNSSASSTMLSSPSGGSGFGGGSGFSGGSAGGGAGGGGAGAS
jgi:uncharacterized membrane protein